MKPGLSSTLSRSPDPPANIYYTTKMTNDEIIGFTRVWVNDIVIGWNLCPFAKPIVDRIRYVVFESNDRFDLIEQLRDEFQFLIKTDRQNVETTLVIIPNAPADFDSFNDMMADANQLLADCKLVGTLQLVAFHPAFRFAGSDPDDPANQTNRSPYPMIHLLREVSVEEVSHLVKAMESIPKRNAAFLRTRALLPESGELGK